MNVGLVTIAAFLLLLPGVSFIVGVNFADKNVREIVFRNTPAEIGYVVFISVVVHLVFVLVFSTFSAASLASRYVPLEFSQRSGKLDLGEARNLLTASLEYFLATAVAGFVPGFLLGRSMRLRFKWKWWTRWVSVFAKHRWMLDLIGAGDRFAVYARVLLNEKFTMPGNSTTYGIVVEGILRDNYFGSDGKLLYLVFERFRELKITLPDPPFVGTFTGEWERNGDRGDQLIIEGQNIALARYFRLALKAAGSDTDVRKLEEALRQDEEDEGIEKIG